MCKIKVTIRTFFHDSILYIYMLDIDDGNEVKKSKFMKEAIKIEKIFLLRHMKFNFFLFLQSQILY
jgi:hypothetical protein